MTPSIMASVVQMFKSRNYANLALKKHLLQTYDEELNCLLVGTRVRTHIIHGITTPQHTVAIMIIFSANSCHLDRPLSDFITFYLRLVHKLSESWLNLLKNTAPKWLQRVK